MAGGAGAGSRACLRARRLGAGTDGGDGCPAPRRCRTQRHVEIRSLPAPSRRVRLQNRHERCATVRCGFLWSAAVPGQGAAPLVFPARSAGEWRAGPALRGGNGRRAARMAALWPRRTGRDAGGRRVVPRHLPGGQRSRRQHRHGSHHRFSCEGREHIGSFIVRNPLPARGGTGGPAACRRAAECAPDVSRLATARPSPRTTTRASRRKTRACSGPVRRFAGRAAAKRVRVALDPLGMASPRTSSPPCANRPPPISPHRARPRSHPRALPARLSRTPGLCTPIRVARRRGGGGAVCVDGDASPRWHAGLSRPGPHRRRGAGAHQPHRRRRPAAARRDERASGEAPPLGRTSVLGELSGGFLAVGPLQVARLDQDPHFPENGTLKLNLGGGR